MNPTKYLASNEYLNRNDKLLKNKYSDNFLLLPSEGINNQTNFMDGLSRHAIMSLSQYVQDPVTIQQWIPHHTLYYELIDYFYHPLDYGHIRVA